MGKNTNSIFVTAELGEMFKNERRVRKLSQLELSDEIGLANSTISKIEKGVCKTNKSYLEKLCSYYGLSIDELLVHYTTQPVIDKADTLLQLMAIEYDIDLTDLDQGMEELRQMEEYSKLDGVLEEYSLVPFPCYLKGKFYEKKRKWSSALEQYGTAVQLISSSMRNADEENLKSACLNGMARVCLRRNNLDEALSYVNNGIEAFNPDGKRHHIQYNLWINKAIILERLNRDVEALLLVESVCEKGSTSIRSSDAWLNLLLIRIELLNKLGRYDEAIHYVQEGLFLARVDGLYDHAFDLWSSLGESYAQKGLMVNAELCYQSALKLEGRIKRKHLAIKTHTHLGIVYCECGKLKLGQSTLVKAVKLAREYKDVQRLVKALVSLSQSLVMLNKDMDAYKHLEEARTIAKEYKFETLLFDILLNMSDICKRWKLADYQEITEEFQEISVHLLKGGRTLMLHQIETIRRVSISDPPND
ncbi:Transcriptional regulator, contains XRE-family HTH domain [Thermoactinomyces sp. DSM 45891]|uniref:helix-turn-helix domain-containing protein n=1 Tax=Thermoactinomyces sp. DSM 45891 TaxID=1761907 RepID=UPI00091BFA92|nr:helix-turn-helix domain-containing protein [Thermoactinomyces sp. DSM 45891]SFX64726.1 Transcriptional regulator, contains XRE-family HTH domain [Thermoactinomyces sp. DSM 45891]